jgi:hypothetical protein
MAVGPAAGRVNKEIFMRTVPETIQGTISFYQAHATAWAEHAAALKLEGAEVAQLAAMVEEAWAAVVDQRTAAQAAQAATLARDLAVRRLAMRGAGMIARIRGVAKGEGDANVYALAQLPAPQAAAPGTVAERGRPYAPRTVLGEDGTVRLSWQCKNPVGAGGTRYEIRRSVDGAAFAHLASVGKRFFLDARIPAGAARVVYEVTAVRSTRRGSPALFNVNFGVETAGGAGGAEPMRRAA